MKKIVIVDIQKEEDLIEKYNVNIVNHNLISYLIKKTIYVNKDEKIEIIIHNKCNTKIDVKENIIEGLKLEYEQMLKGQERNNILQLFLLFLGITLLFLSTFLNDEFIWKEMLLIIGWVPIWEMVDIELFTESKERKIRRNIERLLNSEFKIES